MHLPLLLAGARGPMSVTDAMMVSKLVKRVAFPASVGVSTFGAFVEGDTLTLSDGAAITEIYEFDTDADVTPGNIRVDISVQTPSVAFLAALAANSVLARAVKVVGDVSAERVILTSLVGGTAGNSYTCVASAHGTPDAAVFSGGLAAAVKQTVSVERTILAVEATEGICVIGLPFDATLVLLTMRDSTGARVDDIVVDTSDADSIVISEGATAWGAGDTITLYAEG